MVKRAGRQRKRKSKYLQRKYLPAWILAIILLFIISVFLTGNKSLIQLYSFYRERNELLIEKQNLEAENKRLQEEIERLKKDLEYIEKVAREKYNLKREDEEVYEIVPE